MRRTHAADTDTHAHTHADVNALGQHTRVAISAQGVRDADSHAALDVRTRGRAVHGLFGQTAHKPQDIDAHGTIAHTHAQHAVGHWGGPWGTPRAWNRRAARTHAALHAAQSKRA